MINGIVTITDGKEEKAEQNIDLLPGVTFEQMADSVFAAFDKLIEDELDV